MAGPLRFMMNFLPKDKRSSEVNGFLAGRLKAALQVLEGELGKRDWLVGESLTCADLACCGSTLARPHRGHARLETPL
jgi:glutathione S-transferase